MKQGIIVVISGRIGSGKSTLAKAIKSRFPGVCSIRSTSEYLSERARSTSRESLQQHGHVQDNGNPKWICDVVSDSKRWITVLDSVRSTSQISLIRGLESHKVVHVHIVESVSECKARRPEDVKFMDDELESDDNMMQLSSIANIKMSSDQHFKIMEYLDGLQRVDAIIGGQYGSEGKGHIVSYIAQEYELIVRSGGPNAGHKVNWGGKIFTFFHIPSGLLHNPDALCYIAPSALINPKKLEREIKDLRKLLSGAHPNLVIHPEAYIVEEDDMRVEEVSVKGSIGSTAQGVGAALSRRIMRKTPYRTAKDIECLAPYVRKLDITSYKSVLLEGTQGYGLSIYHGDYPFTTSRDTGIAGLLSELGLPASCLCQAWGVFRTYPIRVQSPDGGTSGPMRGGEISLTDINEKSGIGIQELEATETTSTTFRRRRIANFEMEQFRKTIKNNGITHIAFTFMDYFSEKNRKARSLSDLTEDAQDFITSVATPDIVSCGFDHKHIIDNRG